MKTIVIVEDDVLIGDAIAELLMLEGYGVRRAYSGTEALMLFESYLPDLVLLDLNLPGASGEQVLKAIDGRVPTIILSARSSVSDKVTNLIAGASDYITKPYDSDELLARIAVQLRAQNPVQAPKLRFDDLEIDTEMHTLFAAGKPVKLTKTEFAIIKLLIASPRRVFSKSAIAEGISDYTPDGEESSISVHISSLRHKLRQATDRDYIETVWGIGFRLTT